MKPLAVAPSVAPVRKRLGEGSTWLAGGREWANGWLPTQHELRQRQATPHNATRHHQLHLRLSW